MSNNIVQFNEDMIKGQIKELVRVSGDPRKGEQERIPGEGRHSGCRTEGHEAARGCKES